MMTGLSEMGLFFAELIIGTGEFLLYFWPISAGVLLMTVLALLFPSPGLKSYFGQVLPVLGISYLFLVSILLVGFLLRYDGPPHPNWRQPPDWRGNVLYTTLLLHVLSLVVVIIFLKGRRLRAAALMIPGLWLSVCALPPAGFAIAGVGP